MKDCELPNGKNLTTLLQITERIGIPSAMLLILGYLTLSGFDKLNDGIHAQTIALEKMSTGLQSFQSQVMREHAEIGRDIRDIDRNGSIKRTSP
jgi:hypothetical protein